MDDEDSQVDPYRKKEFSPERGQQFNNFGGEGTSSSTVGGPNDRSPQSAFDPDNPEGRSLPHDGGEGDVFPEDASGLALLPDDSPLQQPRNPNEINPFNNMNNLNLFREEDPYDLLRKRKVRQ